MLVEKKGSTIVRHFDSINEVINLKISNENQNHNVKGEFDRSVRRSNRDWWGVSGGTVEVDSIVENGWHDGWAKAEKILNKLSYDLQLPVKPKKRRAFKDMGDFVDMQRVYSGALDTAWITAEKQPVPGHPTIKIMTAIGGNCNKSTEQLFYKGVCAIILTDILENAGFRVEVTGYIHVDRVFNSNADSVRNLYDVISIKDLNEPLDRLKLITVTAFAGFFRYHLFKALMSNPYECDYCLGSINENTFESVEDDTILLTNVYDENSAIRLINDVLKRFSI